MKKSFSVFSVILLTILMIFPSSITVLAKSSDADIVGKIYEFGEDDPYDISGAPSFKNSDKADTYGTFKISGDFTSTSNMNNVVAYKVNQGSISIKYEYSDSYLNAADDSWHLVSDSEKKVDTIKLDGKIKNGLILLQTSRDHLTWTTVKSSLNVFENTPKDSDSLYESTDVELNNGCYYRMIVAYKLEKKTGEKKILGIKKNIYEYKKVAEVYEFYAISGESLNTPISDEKFSLGTVNRTDKFDGYYGTAEIKKDDPHYGWNLGAFVVSGFTSKVKGEDGNYVFLKNAGDKVKLSFRLDQDINSLNGNSKLSIGADSEGFDQYFQTDRMNFGRGTVIVRYTDYQNQQQKPQIYTNFLEANTTIGADTTIQLFEEGDYEIALDYEITTDKLIDKHAHYRIFVKYSVRNGNCMVFPFDVSTGSELANDSFTENGFYIDLAKSRYLSINVKREILAEGANGLTEDTRFNRPAKDGEQYTDDGIYTLTVKNEYTGELTTKRIYVGTNSILKAFVVNDNLSIAEIQKLVAEGASINADGTIKLATHQQTEQDTDIQSGKVNENETGDKKNENGESSVLPIIIGCIGGVVIIAAAVLIIVLKSQKSKEGEQ